MAYFERLDGTAFRATERTAGAWETTEQHIAPALGLLAHVVETDRDRRRDDALVLSRASFDIWGVVPVDVVTAAVEVLRPGRTVELVEARLSHGGRCVASLRAWLQRTGDTGALAGGDLPRVPGPDEVAAWDPSTLWPGGFIGSVEVRREVDRPGRGRFWVRTDVPLVAGEPVSRRAAAIGLLDIANGMAVRADPREVLFPNLDLTAHLLREPRGAWLGFDTTVTFSAHGTGLTSSVLHDQDGPLGTSNQVLTVRPRG